MKYKRFNPFLVIIFISSIITLAGCETTIPKEALALNPATLEERNYQSRYFDTTDEVQILSASAGVLQDLGFTLDKSETELGFLVASKDRDATDPGQVVAAILLGVLAGAAMAIDKNQKIRVALIINPSLEGNRIHVRAKFQRKVWNTQNIVTKVETLKDIELYQEFFSNLSKSVFLEAHDI